MNPKHPLKLLVAIPCLNEAATIAEVIKGVPCHIEKVDQIDVLVINDGSTDQTLAQATKAGAIVINHSRNMGVGKAFHSAVQYAVNNGYDLMVNIDGDRQFNPQDIPKLVHPVLTGQADMATASRFIEKSKTPSMPKVKLWGNHMMSYLISQLVRHRYYDVSCGFRCYNREALLQLNLQGAFTYTQESFLDFAAKRIPIVEVSMDVLYFPDRVSRVAGSIVKYTVNTVKIIFRGYRDYFPLRFFWGIALILAIPAFVLAVLFFWHYLTYGKFSGYLFAGFSSAFLFILSCVFFVVGTFADMLDRIRTNQERILYLLKKSR